MTSKETTIKKLTNDCMPVKPMPSLFKQILIWLAVAFFSFLTALSLTGIREDFTLIISSSQYMLENAMLFALSILSAMSAFILSIPGRVSKKFIILPVITLLIWGGLLIYLTIGKGDIATSITQVHSYKEIICSTNIVILAIFPALVAFLLVKRGAPCYPKLNSFFILLSSIAFGAFAMQFICHNNNPLHLLLWHFLPVIAVSLIGIGIGRILLRW